MSSIHALEVYFKDFLAVCSYLVTFSELAIKPPPVKLLDWLLQVHHGQYAFEDLGILLTLLRE